MTKNKSVRFLAVLVLAAMLLTALPISAIAAQTAPVMVETELNKLVGYHATTTDPERQGPVFSSNMINDQNQTVTLDAEMGMLSMDFGAAALVSRIELTSANATTALTGDDFDVWFGTENFGKVKFFSDAASQKRAQIAKLSKQDYAVSVENRDGHAVLIFEFFDNAAARYIVIQMKNSAAAGDFVLEQMSRDTAVFGRITASDSYEQLRILTDRITNDDGTGPLPALNYTAFDKKDASLVLDMGSDHAVREIILRAQDEAAQIPAEDVQLYYSADGIEYDLAKDYTLEQSVVDGRRELHFVIDEANAGLLIGRFFKLHYAAEGQEAFVVLNMEQDIQVSYDPFGLPDSDPERRQQYSIGVSAAYFDSRLKAEYGQEALDKRNELSVEAFVIWYLENLNSNFNYLYRWQNIGESVAVDNLNISTALKLPAKSPIDQVVVTSSNSGNPRLKPEDWIISYSNDDRNFTVMDASTMTFREAKVNGKTAHIIDFPEIEAKTLIVYNTYTKNFTEVPAGNSWFAVLTDQSSFAAYNKVAKDAIFYTAPAAVHKLTGDVIENSGAKTNLVMDLGAAAQVSSIVLTPKEGESLAAENWKLLHRMDADDAWTELAGWTAAQVDGKHVITLGEMVSTRYLKLSYTGEFSGEDYFTEHYTQDVVVVAADGVTATTYANTTAGTFAANASYLPSNWTAEKRNEVWALISAEPDPVRWYQVALANGVSIGWAYRVTVSSAIDHGVLRQSVMLYLGETKQVNQVYVPSNRAKTNLRVGADDWYVAYSTDNFTSYQVLTPNDLTVTQGTNESGFPCFTIELPETVSASHLIIYTSRSLGTLSAPTSTEAYLTVTPGEVKASLQPRQTQIKPTLQTTSDAVSTEVYLALENANPITVVELTPKEGTALAADNLELYYWDGAQWTQLTGWTAAESEGIHRVTLANKVTAQYLKLCYQGEFSGSDYFASSYSGYAVKSPESDSTDPVSLATGLTTRGFAYNSGYITAVSGYTAAELWALIVAEPDPAAGYKLAREKGLSLGWSYRIKDAYALDVNTMRQSILFYWAEAKNVSRLYIPANRANANIRITENDWYVAYTTQENFSTYTTLTPEDLTVTKGTTPEGYPCFTIDFPTVTASHLIVYTTHSLDPQAALGSSEAYFILNPNNGSVTAYHVPGDKTLVPAVYNTDPFAVSGASGDFALDIHGNAIGFMNLDGMDANHIVILGNGSITAEKSDFRLYVSDDNVSWTEVEDFAVSTESVGSRSALKVSADAISGTYVKLCYVGGNAGNFLVKELRGNVFAYADCSVYDFSSLYAKAAQIGYAEGDRVPAKGVADAFGSTDELAFDANYRSLVADLGTTGTVNYIKLFDDDGQTRLAKQDLSIYVSDDNVNYSKIEDFDFRQDGKVLHLYNFTASGRYIKVHQNHYETSPYLQDRTAPFEFYGSVKGSLQSLMQVYLMPVFDIHDTEGYAFGQGQWKYYKELTLEGNGDLVHLSYEALGLDALVAEGKLREDYGDLRFATAEGKLLHSFDNGFGFYVRSGDTEKIFMFYGEPNATSVCDGAGTFQVDYGGKTYGPALGGDVHMAMLPDGRMIQIAYADYDELGGEEVYMAISEDNGLTFGDPVRITDTPNHDAQSGGLVVLDDGSVLVTYMWLEKNGGYGSYMDPEKTNMQIYAIRSTDLVNWSEPVMLNTGYTYNLATTNPIQAANGDIYLPLATTVDDSGSVGICVMRSQDMGQTWENVSGLYKNENAYFEGGYSEPCVVELEEGTIRVFFRQGADDKTVKLGQITSYDNGENWTGVEQSDFYATCTQPVAYKLDSGRILLLWAGHNGTGSNTYQRMPVTLVYSDDNGATWNGYQELTGRTLINNPFGHPMALQPDFCYAPDGSLTFMIWVRGTVYAPEGKWVSLRLEDFDRWMEENTGAFDNFEQASVVKNNYWAEMGPRVGVSAEYCTSGRMALRIADNSSIDTATAVRNFMGTKKGSLSVKLNYTSAASGLRLGLWECQPVHVTDAGNMFTLDISKAGVLSWINADGQTVATDATLEPGKWYDITVQFDVAAGTMEILVNGTSVGTAGCTQQQNAIAYFAAYSTGVESSGTEFWLDDLIVIDSEDADVHFAAASDEMAVKELPVISGNLSLNETIDINFIIPAVVDMTDAVLAVKNAATGEDVEYTILPGIGGTTVVRYRARANHMTDEITVQVFDAEGNPLTQMASMSVRKYAGIRFAVAEETEKMMLIRMLDYGALAQINSGVTTDLANSIVTDDLRAFADAYDWADAVQLEVPAGSGGVFKAGLALNETIDVTVYTAATNVAVGDKFVVKCNGEELTEDQYIVRLLDDGRYVIRYSVKSNEMSDEIYIAIVGEDNTVKAETTLGVRIYAQKFLAAVPTGNQAAMLLAMLDYGAMAQIYAGNTENLANCFVTDDMRQVLIGYAWP